MNFYLTIIISFFLLNVKGSFSRVEKRYLQVLIVEGEVISKNKKSKLNKLDKIKLDDILTLNESAFISLISNSGRVFEFSGMQSINIEQLELINSDCSYPIDALYGTVPLFYLREYEDPIYIAYPKGNFFKYLGGNDFSFFWSIRPEYIKQKGQYLVLIKDEKLNILEEVFLDSMYCKFKKNKLHKYLTSNDAIIFHIEDGYNPEIRSKDYVITELVDQGCGNYNNELTASTSVLIGLQFESFFEYEKASYFFKEAVNLSGQREVFQMLDSLHNIRKETYLSKF